MNRAIIGVKSKLTGKNRKFAAITGKPELRAAYELGKSIR